MTPRGGYRYEINISVKGETVDFAIDYNENDGDDTTVFTAKIWETETKKDRTRNIIRGNSIYGISEGTSWNTARENSKKLGGHLVTIESGQENKFVFDKFGYDQKTGKTISSGYWIGFTDQKEEGVEWISS